MRHFFKREHEYGEENFFYCANHDNAGDYNNNASPKNRIEKKKKIEKECINLFPNTQYATNDDKNSSNGDADIA